MSLHAQGLETPRFAGKGGRVEIAAIVTGLAWVWSDTTFGFVIWVSTFRQHAGTLGNRVLLGGVLGW